MKAMNAIAVHNELNTIGNEVKKHTMNSTDIDGSECINCPQ
jgi:hypothetical protein